MNNWLKTILPAIILATLILAISPIPAHPHLSLPPSSPLLPQPAQPPSLQIETIVNLGLPAGNGATPKHLALNSQAEQLYILSEGVPVLKQGNGLSLYNLKTGQIVEHIKINQGDNEALDLQFDPQAGLIYALWQERFGDTLPNLTVIDSQSLQLVQEISRVEALATADSQLYAANAEELISVNLSNNSLAEAQRVNLSLGGTTGPMAISSVTNRLYLARNINGLWHMEIFEADTLTPVASYPADTAILNILPLPGAGQVLVIAALDSFRTVYRLTTDGELVDMPYELGPRYGAAGIALSQDKERLYFSNGQLRPYEPAPTDTTGPALVGLSSSGDLSLLHNIPLPTNFDDLVIDDNTHQAFALYPFDNFLYVVNLRGETVEIVNTAIDIRDVLFDVEVNQIFVSDSANRIRRLDTESFEVLAETQLQGNNLDGYGRDYGFKSAGWSGELALDQARNRLYVSGLPALVLEADTLAEIATLKSGGQLAPDPTGDNIYLSNCGITVLDAATLSGDSLIPGSGPRPDDLSPNPCVSYSRLDPVNQLLYSLVPNGTPGSNSGNYLYVYDLALAPTLIFTDTDINIVQAEPDPVNRRAFVNYVRHSNKRLRTLAVPGSGKAAYTQHLLGLWGGTRYSPTTNHLYLGDRDHNRLLTLAANTLSVLDELALPAKYGYRLVDLDPTTDRLYLVGFDGQLLIASPDDSLVGPASPSPPPREPTGDILALAGPITGTLLARIESVYDNTPSVRLYRSRNEDQAWTDLSQNLPPLPVQALAVANDDGEHRTLFAGLLAFGQTGGLYKSTDGGQSWTPAMAGLQDLWVEALFISPNFDQSGLIFAKTTHAGLHHSLDGGQTWTPLYPLAPTAFFPSAGHSAAVAFDDQDTILVSQSLAEMTGIFRATLRPNGTLSAWEQVLDLAVDHLAFSPDGRIILASGTGLWRSIDGGQSWQAGGAGLTGVENLQPDRFLFSPTFARDKTVYFFFKDNSGALPARFFRSQDGGQSWQAWLDPISSGNNFTAVALTATGDFIFGDATTQLTRISPSALKWTDPQAGTVSFPLDDLAISPDFDRDQTLFAVSSEYGLFKSTDGGQSWQLTSFPVRTHRFSFTSYHVALSPTYQQDQTLFIATGRSLHRSTDGGQSWAQLLLTGGRDSKQPLSFKAQQVALSPHFASDQTVLVGTGAALYRSTDGGDTWQQGLKLAEATSGVDVLLFAPDGDTAYARFGYGQSLFSSTDSGQTWQKQSSTTEEYFSITAADTTAAGSLTAAVEFSTRLLQTDAQSQPWHEIGQLVPADLTSVEALAYGPDDTLFIGGPGGVFRTQDNGQSWQVLTGLAPGANITHLYATEAHLIATSAEGNIFISGDNGGSWREISVIN
jgi:photosystem II stability/assembly factor-like uncharacterized protein/DNA-binding beta-propeller fold protein YncE